MDGGVPNYYQSWTSYKTLSQFVYLLSRLQPTERKRKERQERKKLGNYPALNGEAGGGGGGGGGAGTGRGKKEKKEVGKKGEGIGERRKGMPAIINTTAKRLPMRQVEHFRSLFQSLFPVRS